MPPKVIAIAAMDHRRVIGYQGHLPWSLPQDLARFKQLTSGGIVVVGRRTFETLPRLKDDREVVVVTRDLFSQKLQDNLNCIAIVSDIAKLLKYYATSKRTIWIAGGAEIYQLTRPYWDELQLTVVDGVHYGDTYMPPFEAWVSQELSREQGLGCEFVHYRMVKG